LAPLYFLHISNMEGQIQWDGLVLPIADVTWENVLATARRLQGLEMDEDFFVTYKDEEGDLINVKNEVDLAEAIRWAQEQGVPNLCLEVPFSSAEESDSDDSWMEIDNGSPKGSASRAPAPAEEALDLTNDETQESPLAAEEEHVPETHVEEEQAPEQSARDEEPKEDQAAVEHDVEHQVVSLQAVDNLPDLASGTRQLVEVTPITSVFGKVHPVSPVVVTPMPFMFQDTSPVPATPVSTHATIDNFVGLLYSVNELPTEDDVDDKQLLVDFFSSPEGLRNFVEFISNQAVQQGIVAVAESEKAHPGSALKAASTQLIKVLCKNQALFEQLNGIPDLEILLPRLLRKLKIKSVVEKVSSKPEVVHSCVTCDGCESSEVRANLAMEAGHRNDAAEIVGVRYKSATIPNYDICETCEASGLFQEHAGPFLKIVDPATAPDVILCALPGTTQGMMSQVESLDWRNPLAREFLEFVQSKRQRAFPQQRTAEATPAPAPAPTPRSAETSVPAVTAAPQLRCKHALTTFETPHGSFSCDVCMKKQPVKTTMHGCRSCNFDVCNACNVQHGILPAAAPVAAPTVISTPPSVMTTVESAPPQAKFVSDVTLADGCVVRPGEKLSKVWRVRNSGAERWPAGTRIGHVGGDAFGGPLSGVEVPLAAPGEAVNVSVPFVMPVQPGRYTSYWRMMTPHPQNAKFGHRFWVTVNVVPQVVTPAVPVPQGQPRAFPGQIIRAPPTVQGLRGIFPTAPPPPPPQGAYGFVTGSPVVAGRSAPRPPPPPLMQREQDAEEPVVNPELELAVAQITEFGFTDIDKIVKILKEVNGDAGAAIDKLLEEA
jgi:hypothetical protein